MKATLSKNYRFIQLSEKPKKAEVDGFKIFHRHETKTTMPITSTNLIADKTRYYLHMLPKELRESIYRLEIKTGGLWESVPLKSNNSNPL